MTSSRWLSPKSLVLFLAAACLLFFPIRALTQTGPPALTLSVIGSSSVSGVVGTSSSASYSLSVGGAPAVGSECTVWAGGTPGPWSGPTYSMSASSSDSSGVSVSASPTNASTTTVTFNFLKPGDYTVTVTGSVSYSSSCGSASKSASKTVSVHVSGKVWDTGSAIDGGTASGPTTLLDEGQQVTVSVSGASDSDHWTKGTEQGTEADTLTYAWSSSGGAFSNGTSASATWTAPNLASNEGEKTFTLTCTINDTPKAIPSTESGTRDDAAVTKSVTVTVVQKFWTTPSDINKGTLSSSAEMVDEGEQVTVGIAGASDSDHWKKGSQEGDEADDLTYTWSSPGGGSFNNPNSASAVWTAPNVSGNSDSQQFVLKCVINDTPKAIGPNDGGSRDDEAVTVTVPVTVTQKYWDTGDDIQGGSTITPTGGTIAGGVLYIEHGQTLTLTMEAASDSDHWVYRDTEGTDADEINYEWSGGMGLSSNGNGQSVTVTGDLSNYPLTIGSVQSTLKCTAYDTPKPIDPGDGGSRDDEDAEAQIPVIVVRKMWSANPAINGGTVTTSINGGTVTPPAEAMVDEAGVVTLAVSGASDTDTWTKGLQTGTDADELEYHWTASKGTFATPDAASSTWTAPNSISGAEEEIDLKCTINDKPKGIAAGEGGSRNDDPVTKTVTVKVSQKVWDAGAPLDGGETMSVSVNQGTPVVFEEETVLFVDQGSNVALSMEGVTDQDHWVYRDTEGEAADEIEYEWSGDGGVKGELSAHDVQGVTWSVPMLLPGVNTLSFTLKCVAKNKPLDVVAPDAGTRDDGEEKTFSLHVTIVRPGWTPTDKEIGYHPKKDQNGNIITTTTQSMGRTITSYVWEEDGRLIAPIDQRDEESPDKKVVIPGEEVPCQIEVAQDWDTFTNAMAITSSSDGPLTYTWTAPKGHFKVTHQDGSVTLENSVSGLDSMSVKWVAPGDIAEDTNVTITCSVDDPAGDRVTAPISGSHNDDALVREVEVKVVIPQIQFDGELMGTDTVRACAGGIDDHTAVDPDTMRQKDYMFRAHTRKVGLTLTLNGQPLPNKTFTLQFEGNKGHHFPGRSTVRTARLHNMSDVFDEAHWKESLDVTTDSDGKVTVWVLSSDVICKPELQAVIQVVQDAQPIEIGSLKCDFDAAVSLRRFPNWINPEDLTDNGWLFGQRWLSADGPPTTAKVYMKFMVDKTLGDIRGNWQEVNGHRMLFEIEKVDLSAGGVASNTSDYATLIATEADGSTIHATTPGINGAMGGAATATMTAGPLINDAATVWIAAYDENQWEQ